ncbi:hypothetical protein T492DRAFT_963772 [Pavlovales sp. CCMP2436]|nr:hypothetical protein T492DRAFT_963772 [Pavlovales sp. CCMP2436]
MTEPDPWAGWHPDGWKSDAICACGQILGRGCVCLMVPDMARRTPDGSGFEEYQDWELERLASGYEKRQRRLVARSWKEPERAAARKRAILEAQQRVRESDAPYEMARRLVESVTVSGRDLQLLSSSRLCDYLGTLNLPTPLRPTQSGLEMAVSATETRPTEPEVLLPLCHAFCRTSLAGSSGAGEGSISTLSIAPSSLSPFSPLLPALSASLTGSSGVETRVVAATPTTLCPRRRGLSCCNVSRWRRGGCRPPCLGSLRCSRQSRAVQWSTSWKTGNSSSCPSARLPAPNWCVNSRPSSGRSSRRTPRRLG